MIVSIKRRRGNFFESLGILLSFHSVSIKGLLFLYSCQNVCWHRKQQEKVDRIPKKRAEMKEKREGVLSSSFRLTTTRITQKERIPGEVGDDMSRECILPPVILSRFTPLFCPLLLLGDKFFFFFSSERKSVTEKINWMWGLSVRFPTHRSQLYLIFFFSWLPILLPRDNEEAVVEGLTAP